MKRFQDGGALSGGLLRDIKGCGRRSFQATRRRWTRPVGVLLAAVTAAALLATVPAPSAAAPGDGPSVIIASGWSAADASTATAMAAAFDGYVLYAYPDRLGEPAALALERIAPRQVFVIGGTAAVPASVFTEVATLLSEAQIERVHGQDRTGTAAAAARRAMHQRGGTVVIASGWSPSDVATAAAFAASQQGAVLFTARDRLGEATRSALEDLAPSQAVILGGHDAVAEEVRSEIVTLLDGVRIERYFGADPTATAAVIAATAEPGRPVVLASGWSPSDGGVAAAVAASVGGTILHTELESLGDATTEALRRLRPSKAIFVGGTAAVPAETIQQAKDLLAGTRVIRLRGADRVGTAALAAEYAYCPEC